MGILEKIKEIELEVSRTQKNKATESHLGRLKGKLARYRSQLLTEGSGPKGSGAAGFEVKKSGDVRVSLVGFPSAGKSTLLSSVTSTESAIAAYEFTTLTCVPGVLNINGTKIQLLDLPGIVEGAAEGRGRGKQVIATARTSDLILMIIDAAKAEEHRGILEGELERIGIRLNQSPPKCTVTIKQSGSMNVVHFTTTVRLTHLTEETVRVILHDYKIFNADVLIREDITIDQFIDVIEGNRQYLPCLYCYSKADTVCIEELERLSRLPNSVVFSCLSKYNIDWLIEDMWQKLDLRRIYTKRPKAPPDFDTPFIMKSGATIADVCKRIHKDILPRFKSAMLWGTSAKHCPQRVGRDHLLDDEDVIQIFLASGVVKEDVKVAKPTGPGRQIGRQKR